MSVKELSFSDNTDEEVEGTEVKEVDVSSVTSDGRETWVNEKRNPIHLPIVCRVPQKIVVLMRSVENIMSRSGMSQLEFGAFLHGEFNQSGILMISEDFHIPAQDVSGAAIDFNEQPPEVKYNGVIHRHPNGCKSFSGTDGAHINKNFEFSLLYVSNDITLGIFNLEVNGVRIQLPLSVEVMYPITELSVDQITEKIHKKSMPSSTTSQMEMMGFTDRRDVRAFLNEHNEQDEEVNYDEDEKMCTCKRCGQVQFVDSFPVDCEGCDMKLNEEDVEMMNDLTEETTDRPSLDNDNDDDEDDMGSDFRPFKT